MSLTTKPNTFQNGTTADATAVNANFDAIFNDHNGNITDANIAASGITTYGKVDGGAIKNLNSLSGSAGVIPVANIDTGTTANKIVKLDGSAKLPALDGSLLTGLPTPSAFVTGMIIMWSGTIATIPSGWRLCNGSNSTPDLRNRFIVAADADSGGVAKTTVTGSPTQSGNGSIPDHTHTVNYNGAGDDTPNVYKGGEPTFPYMCYSQSFTPSSGLSGGSFGTGSTNIAVYYALAFIMKS